MTTLNSKWIVFSFLLACVIFLLSFLGCAKVQTEIVIPAPPDAVWSVLTDASGFKEWNPLLIPFEGELKEGEKLKYRMVQPDGKESVVGAKVVKMVNQQLLNQCGGIPGVLTFDHKWVLEPVDNGTRVMQHEEYRGIGVWFWDYSWVQPAYRKANEALRDRVVHLKNRN